MEFKFKKIGISHIIDFKDLSDDFIMVGRNKIQAIGIKVRIQGAKTIVRFQSNFSVENTLEYPLEYSIFRDIDGGMGRIDPYGDLRHRQNRRMLGSQKSRSRNSSLSRTTPSLKFESDSEIDKTNLTSSTCFTPQRKPKLNPS